MATLATLNFTGTNGTAPSGWTTYGTLPSGASAVIQANAYRLTSPTATYTPVSTYYSALASRADFEVVFDLTFHATKVEQYCQVAVRGTGMIRGDGVAEGVGLSFSPNANVWGVYDGFSGYSQALSGDMPFTFTAGTTYSVRLRAVGSTVSARLWAKSANEPSTWAYTGTTYSGTGYFVLSSGSGNVGQRTLTVDNVTITDGAPPAANYSGTLTLSGAGTLSAQGSPTLDGTVGLSGTGSYGTAGTPHLRGSVALSGSGTTEATGTPAVAASVSLAGAGQLDRAGAAHLGAALYLDGSGQLVLVGSAQQVPAGFSPYRVPVPVDLDTIATPHRNDRNRVEVHVS